LTAVGVSTVRADQPPSGKGSMGGKGRVGSTMAGIGKSTETLDHGMPGPGHR
jgi:hypothetical protein